MLESAYTKASAQGKSGFLDEVRTCASIPTNSHQQSETLANQSHADDQLNHAKRELSASYPSIIKLDTSMPAKANNQHTASRHGDEAGIATTTQANNNS